MTMTPEFWQFLWHHKFLRHATWRWPRRPMSWPLWRPHFARSPAMSSRPERCMLSDSVWFIIAKHGETWQNLMKMETFWISELSQLPSRGFAWSMPFSSSPCIILCFPNVFTPSAAKLQWHLKMEAWEDPSVPPFSLGHMVQTCTKCRTPWLGGSKAGPWDAHLSKMPLGTAHGASHPEEHQVIPGIALNDHGKATSRHNFWQFWQPPLDAPSQDNKYNDPVSASRLWNLDPSSQCSR